VRATARANGLSVKAYAGSTGVLLAMDVDPERRRGLLGFAIERSGSGKRRWLNGLLDFPGSSHAAGQPVETRRAPIQKFRWSDYTALAGKKYRYTVHPVYGSAASPELRDGPSVRVETHRLDRGDHSIVFNRAAAASQAFSRDFPEVERAIDAARDAGRPPPPLPPRALRWLSRGVLEQIVGFVDAAEPGRDALDVAIYEYELPAIVEAVDHAQERGVDVRLVFHAKAGDHQTEVNRAAAASLAPGTARPRRTSKICHHKFIVRSRLGADGSRTPEEVLCGSTNFTENGVYRQGNVVHVVRRADVAGQFLELFEVLFRGDDVRATRAHVDRRNPIRTRPRLFAGFSPRSQPDDLDRFGEIVGGAERDVLFCTAFDLFDPIEDALLGTAGDPVLRYGLQNSRSRITGFHADRGADFAATAMLNRGLEGFLKESTAGQRGNILIHTKLVVVDFTSSSPTVISGSHNLSRSASNGNDENFLVMRGDTDVADCYGVELMRLYDHYRFRHHVRGATAARGPLAGDDSWTDRYFERGSLRALDRMRFAGAG
jgi:phosphatidylserine/phosphatidylglycerophosphate/cardiolipin synthase-like enzyme